MATKRQTIEVGGLKLAVSNLDKVMYPETGTTKGDVLDYYLQIAPVLVPQAAWRPATRKRWVNGVGTADDPGEVFFRKDLEDGTPGWVPTGKIVHKERTNVYPLANNAAVLAWFAQLAALEVHVPQWRFGSDGAPRNPDRLVLDLDPGEGAGLKECVAVAHMIRDILTDMKLDAVPVTSGSKGIHLYAPLDGRTTSDQVAAVAKQLAESLEKEAPKQVIAIQKRAERAGKVLVDWSQNNAAKTTVCPYSLRGRMRPTVACPRTWDELDDPKLAQLDYREVLKRVADGLDPIADQGWPFDQAPEAPKKSRSADSGTTDKLTRYREKRDANLTPEPVPEASGKSTGGKSKARETHKQGTSSTSKQEDSADSSSGNVPTDDAGDEALTFVIQEHHARRLHWDFRLEHDGVLASWAVPKGPPLSSDEHRLAVQVEDHPLDYGSFEGVIPKGQYGGGTVTIWDAGTIEVEKWRSDEIIVVLHGRKTGGLGGLPRRYVLVRTSGGGEKAQWLLIFKKDQPAAAQSRVGKGEDGSDRHMGQRGSGHKADDSPPDSAHGDGLREGDDKSKKSEPDDAKVVSDLGKEPELELPDEAPAPMLATLGSPDDLDDGQDWALEMKWDGVRAICLVAGNRVRLVSRNGNDVTERYPELAELASALNADAAILDGEIVALDQDGRPDFELLQPRMHLDGRRAARLARENPVTLMLFDVLSLTVEGSERRLMRTGYRQRRELLEAAVEPTERIRVPSQFDGSLPKALEHAKAERLEGVMAKRQDSVYVPGRRSRQWIKIKHRRDQSAVIVGWRVDAEDRLRSLLLAVPDDDGTLHYAGRVGSGISPNQIHDLEQKLQPIERKTPPLGDVPAADRHDARWVRPSLVGEVAYAEVTHEGKLRSPVWRGWRDDVIPDDVRWEKTR
ncbi:ATP-dependent DNA ligase [Propionimicrobium sp. PCR01-08-3]|uniref:ATP-dependent DNA ligase n=1 Tax=Propionimicrobium sp. PCR01-08-3 TaxID=3052086 RepID=UPI00255CCEE8|nr:ATP-dependent DNA ligase [Propionimicrobium sp. PCR01-08-3]WIY82926.1 ATP-dependent DNA ligase [Propionimicrobium sp. PCR01-08-3]